MDALIRNGRDEIEQSQLVFAERVADALGDGPAAYMSHEFLADLTASETNDTAIMTFALFDLFEDDGSSFAERYVRRERKTMSAADREHAARMIASTVEFYEVREVARGRGMLLRRLKTNRDTWVDERAATESLSASDVIAARLIEIGSDEYGLYPPVVPFSAVDGADTYAIVERIRREFKRIDPSLTALQTKKLTLPYITAIWIERTALRSDPTLRTSSGEPFTMTYATISFRHRAAVAEALEESLAFESDDGEEYVYLDEPAPPGMNRKILGGVRLCKRKLELETPSEERMDRLIATLKRLTNEPLTLVKPK